MIANKIQYPFKVFIKEFTMPSAKSQVVQITDVPTEFSKDNCICQISIKRTDYGYWYDPQDLGVQLLNYYPSGKWSVFCSSDAALNCPAILKLVKIV